MKKVTTSSRIAPAEIVKTAWEEVGVSFERFCLSAGIATLTQMMEEDASALCGSRYGRSAEKNRYRWGKTKGKIGFGFAELRFTGGVSLLNGPASATRPAAK